MDTLLFLAHTEANGALPRLALEALSAAKSFAASLGSPSFQAGLVGSDLSAAAAHISGCGASRLLGVSGPDFGVSRYSTDVLAAEAIVRTSGASIVVAPATLRWNRVLGGVSQRLGGGIDTHVSTLAVQDGAPAASRWFYRQRMEGSVTRTARPWFILLESGCAPACEEAPGSVSLETISVSIPDAHRRTTVTGLRSPASDRQTIRPDAKLLFVAGAGWTKKQADGQPHPQEAEQLILGFIDKTQASLGSTKSLVDLSGEGQAVLKFMTHLNQVGQTGSTPRHPKGLATCCHGEEPHTVGWRFITERRAINLNPSCSWAQGKADVLYVADAFVVMKTVNDLLG